MTFRHTRSLRPQVVGQFIGIPVPYVLTLFVAMWVAGVTSLQFGKAVWQLPDLFLYWDPVVAVIAALLLSASTLMNNVLANIISPINDIMNLAPERFTYRGCGYVVLLLSLAVCPWWTFSGRTSFVLNFLSGYAMITGAITGVFLADYWILRQRELDLEELYASTGVNWKAVLAVCLGAAPCVPGFLNALIVYRVDHEGLVSPFWAHLYSGGSCFFSLTVAGAFYLLFSFPARSQKKVTP